MSLVTPARLRAIYTMLLHMPPYARWGLAHPEAVKFIVLTDPGDTGSYNIVNDRHVVGVNAEVCSDLLHVERTVAHEMIHMRQELLGRRPTTRDDQHNREFWRMARLVCRTLGYSSEGF